MRCCSPPTQVAAHFLICACHLRPAELHIYDLWWFEHGVVMSQFHHGPKHPVAVASRLPTQAEQKYSVGEKAALVCVHLTLTARPSQPRWPQQARDTSHCAFSGGWRCITTHGSNLSGKTSKVACFPEPCPTPHQIPTKTLETEVVLMLHTLLKTTIFPVRGTGSIGTGPCTYQANLWSSERTGGREFHRNQCPFHRVRTDLTCWKDICMVRGLYTLWRSSNVAGAWSGSRISTDTWKRW